MTVSVLFLETDAQHKQGDGEQATCLLPAAVTVAGRSSSQCVLSKAQEALQGDS
jgi:hypothetical protein